MSETKPLTNCVHCGHSHWKHLSGFCQAQFVAERAGYCGCTHFAPAPDAPAAREEPTLDDIRETEKTALPGTAYKAHVSWLLDKLAAAEARAVRCEGERARLAALQQPSATHQPEGDRQ